MTYLRSKDLHDCFGCGACEQICPVSAISMEADREGFLYPVVSESCISCGRCIGVCPAEETGDLKESILAAAAFHRKESIRKGSASGGAFGAIVAAADENTVVFGAKWDGRSRVCHAGAPAQQAYGLFHKSKYIQSHMGSSYREVREHLRRGDRVIFTGTPCQIAGLRQFLGRDDPLLLCVDLVCHGVPSGRVLEAYLCRKDRRNDPVVRMDFRAKKKRGSKWDSKFAELHYRSGRTETVDYDSSGFLRGFAAGLFFRPSCAACPFARRERVSDLTIGDYWGIEREIPGLDAHEGVSLILVNTEKGQQYLERMSQYLELFPTDPETAVRGNARLRRPDPGHRDRAGFFAGLDSVDFERLVQRSVPRISPVRKLGHQVKKFLRRG